MASTDDIMKDIEELKCFLEQASRQKVKDILGIEIRKLETELIRRQEVEKRMQADSNSNASQSSTSVTKPRCTVVQVKNYAWDQSEKFMKLYVTINGVQSSPKENITCVFTDRSVKLQVDGLQNKNYELYIANLTEKIIADESYYKVKTDMILVMLKKAETGNTWAYVTQVEAKAKERKTPKMSEDKDPQEGLMDMMKQMYEEGDDEMKRTIAKAWSESRGKQGMNM